MTRLRQGDVFSCAVHRNVNYDPRGMSMLKPLIKQGFVIPAKAGI